MLIASDDASQAATHYSEYNLSRRIAGDAGIKTGSRLGTHGFRRAFAHRLRDADLRELEDLGGWKTEKTVLSVYLQPDDDAQRPALKRLSAT